MYSKAIDLKRACAHLIKNVGVLTFDRKIVAGVETMITIVFCFLNGHVSYRRIYQYSYKQET